VHIYSKKDRYISKYKIILNVHSTPSSGAAERNSAVTGELSLCIGNGSWNPSLRFKERPYRVDYEFKYMQNLTSHIN
jgi:hypothetical protein